MIHGQTVLGVIPARAGSKRLPGKNLKLLGGKPLIAWTIQAAKASSVIDSVLLSSDDEQILESAQRLGCEVVSRPTELATDSSSSVDTVLHAMDSQDEEHDWVVLLQPTSPLRISQDIDNCVHRAYAASASSCIAVTAPESSPYLCFRLDDQDQLEPLLDFDLLNVRSQDFPPTYAINGSIYVATTEWLRSKHTFIHREALGYVMPRARSVDIDTEEDFLLAEAIIARTASTT